MSLHEMWMTAVDDKVAAEPGAFTIYTDLRRQMNAGKFDPYIDIVTQRDRGFYDLYDAYTFGQIHSYIVTGEILVQQIWLGAVPSNDAAQEANNEKLKKLPMPFKAHFRGGQGDDDGTLEWVEPFHVQGVELKPRAVALEVGDTRPATTWRHLFHEKFLARWPYGHTSIWLLHRVTPNGRGQ